MSEIWLVFAVGLLFGLLLFPPLRMAARWLADSILPPRYLAARGVRRRQSIRRTDSDEQ